MSANQPFSHHSHRFHTDQAFGEQCEAERITVTIRTISSLKFLNIIVVLGGLSTTFSLAYTPLIVLLACSAEKKPHLWV